MKLGFVTAILPDQTFDEVLDFASAEGFSRLEVMCWPPGKAERRYAGVTHIAIGELGDAQANEIRAKVAERGIAISALGYYPNPLSADREEADVAARHLADLIRAAPKLGVATVTSFIGRDPAKSIEGNWPRFLEVWEPLIKLAEDSGVRVGIENCPMYFSADEWPSGKNLAISPSVWRRMFEAIPSDSFGLNFDPSHLVWQQMDCGKALREFAPKLFHVHAKDVAIHRERLDDVGILATPLEYHSPKLPGLGDVDWPRFFATLTGIGYDGPVCIEVEDRAYEGSLAARHGALRQSARFLRQYLADEVGASG